MTAIMMIASTTLKPGGGRRGFARSSLLSLLLLPLLFGLSHSNSDATTMAQRQYVFVKLESIGDVRPAEASVGNVLLIINNDPGKLNAFSAQPSSFYYEWNKELDSTRTSSYVDTYGRSPAWSIFNNADTGGTTLMEADGTLRVCPLESMSSYADIYGDREGIWIKTTESYEADSIKELQLSVSLKFGRGYNNPDRYYKIQVGVGLKEDDFRSFQVVAEVIAAPTITATKPGNNADFKMYTAEWDASTALEETLSSDKCTIPAATIFIITGSPIRADNGETPEWFELAEIKLFTADGTNVAPDASYEFLVEPFNPQDKDVMTDGEIFNETSGKFVVWGGSEQEEEQEQLVYTFRGEDLVQITFDSPVELVGIELYSTNYESGTDYVVTSVETGPLPLRIVYDTRPNQDKAYAHCLENGVEFAVGTNCSTRDGAAPPFRNCGAQVVPMNVEKENIDTDSNTATFTTATNCIVKSSSSSSSSFFTYSVAIVAASVVSIIMTTTTTMMAF